jgi:hypothetical protein
MYKKNPLHMWFVQVKPFIQQDKRDRTGLNMLDIKALVRLASLSLSLINKRNNINSDSIPPLNGMFGIKLKDGIHFRSVKALKNASSKTLLYRHYRTS